MIGKEHRKGNGQFKRGNPGGPGNPGSDRAVRMAQAIREAIEPEVVAGIMRKAAQLALQGDVKAMQIVLDRYLGKPQQHVTIEGDIRQTVHIVQAGIEKLAKRLDRGELSLN